MKAKLKHICNKVVIILLCIISICSTVFSSAIYANANGYYNQLGTNTALGSPVLNNNFVADDWNKWELITWGLFLSNFCTPLVDDYQSAFTTGSGGSNGSGYKALCFSSGNDSNNNETIKQLCTYAVNVQKQSMGTLYVTYSLVERGNVLATVDPNSYSGTGKCIREANFKDFVMMELQRAKHYYSDIDTSTGIYNDLYKPALATVGKPSDTKGSLNSISNLDLTNLKDTITNKVETLHSVYSYLTLYGVDQDASGNDVSYTFNEDYNTSMMFGLVPTFWVKQGSTNSYVKVFDYLNPWDIQISTLMVSKAISSNLKSEFEEAYKSSITNSVQLKLDFFGNIVTSDGKMVIPGSANQNLTTTNKINLVNSFIMNGTHENYSSDKILAYARQYIDELGIFQVDKGATKAALPALSGAYGKLGNGASYIYFDSDNAILKNDKSYGEMLSAFFDNTDIKSNIYKYNLKVEAVNTLKDSWFNDSAYSEAAGLEVMADNQIAASLISSYINKETQPEILTDITMIDGTKVGLFGDSPILIPVAVKSADDADKDAKDNPALNTRKMWNFFYQCYKGNIKETSAGSLSPDMLKKNLREYVKNGEDVGKLLSGELVSGSDNLWDIYKEVYNIDDVKYDFTNFMDYCGNETFSTECSRCIVLYPTSEVYSAVSNILGVVAGTEFGVYSPYIYATYLEFYGMKGSFKINGSMEDTSDFNEKIYTHLENDELTDITKILEDTKTKEDIEKELINYSYLMLSPEAGREYRTDLVMTGLTDFIYDQYQRIVYGTAVKDNYSLSTTSKSNSGFLHVDNYSENFLTAAFIENYADIAMWIIMISVIIMFPIGLIKGRKPIWFLVTLFVVINTVLITPSVGEIIPYFTSEMVQTLFTNKMTYWSISEAVTNSDVEADAALQSNELNGLTKDEAQTIVNLIKSLNVVYLDRSLMLKRDISAKTIQEVSDNYSEIQNLRSARWLLPMIMRQYSQDNNKSDYVYIQIGDLMDDMSNLYWYYDPADATITTSIKPTLTSTQNDKAAVADLDNIYQNATSKLYFKDFKDIYDYDDSSDIEYQSYAYTQSGGVTGTVDVGKNLYHTYNYILQGLSVPSRSDYTTSADYEGVESLSQYSDSVKSSGVTIVNNYQNKAEALESVVAKYDRGDRETVKSEYGYLWATESPAHFFYGNVKESFNSSMTTGALIGQLQGKYSTNKDGDEVRDCFMFATETTSDGTEYATGYVRDVLDLQGMFTNMVPYLYQTQIIMGGMDGNGGVLTQEVIYNEGTDDEYTATEPIIIDDVSVYEGQNQSWLFRSNWVVKLMECPEYDKPMTVRDSSGNKYTVTSPLLTECYPDSRPMVFSEAQMKAYGLDEGDLNVVELKCIKANKDIVDKWTLLINYAGTSGITLEILERQMAIDAMLVFNDVFSPSSTFNSAYEMYPQTLDLRNISFDSVMKMLMINVSHDTSYIYGDTMNSLIENTDLITAVFLLLDAFLCAAVIPFFRNLLMAGIFYLGFVAIVRSLFSDPKYKTKLACGQLVSNVVFLFITLCYYFVFYVLINITSADEVLTVDRIQVTAGNPIWCLIIVLVASIAYIAFMMWQINFCFKNYRDMGIEMYSSMMHSVTGRITRGLKGIRSDISGSSSGSTRSGTYEHKSTRSHTHNETVTNNTTESIIITDDKDKNKGKTGQFRDDYSSNYTTSNDRNSSDVDLTAEINQSIKDGESTKK